MTKSPWKNALAALIYIVFVAGIMFYGMDNDSLENTFLMPVAVLSLFTLSAAVMAYIFFYQPFQMYFDGKKQEALKLFVQTVAFFAGATLLLFILLFSGTAVLM